MIKKYENRKYARKMARKHPWQNNAILNENELKYCKKLTLVGLCECFFVLVLITSSFSFY